MANKFAGTISNYLLATSAIALALSAMPSLAFAQDEPAATEDSEEVVITATRRETTLAETPLSVSIVDAEQLQRDGITSVLDLNGRLPNVQIGTQSGGARIAIRGIGFNPIRPGDEGRVSYYVDGVYVARPSAQQGALFDIDNIQVLRGPQGTLYGRNATGGALLLTTRDPTRDVSGNASVTIGDYNLREFSGALAGPLTDTLSGRIAFSSIDREGYGTNLVTGNDINDMNSNAVRGTLLWEPTDQFSLRITADSFEEDDANNAAMAIRPGYIAVFPSPYYFGSQDARFDFDPQNYAMTEGISATAAYEIDAHYTLSATAGVRHSEARLFLNGGGSEIFLTRSMFKDNSDQQSLDVQLTRSGERLHWILGGSYFREEQTPQLRSAFISSIFGGPLSIPVQGTNSTAEMVADARAIFGELTYDITERLSLTVGARYAEETKEANNEYSSISVTVPWPDPLGADDGGFVLTPPRAGFPRSRSMEFDSFTPTVSLNYQFSDDFSAYITYVEGFKSGGYNYGTAQDPYDPEEIANTEIGVRGSFFNGRLTGSAAVFSYEYSALQQTVQQPLPNPGTFVLNTGEAEIQGFEIEFVARPTDNIQIDGNFSTLDGEFGSFLTVDPTLGGIVDIAGNPIPQAPEHTLYLGGQYTWFLDGGELTLRGDWRQVGDTYFDIYAHEPAKQEEYDVLGANLTWQSSQGNWRASAWIRNIEDTYAASSMSFQSNPVGGILTGTVIAPRTTGVTIGYSF